MSLHRQLGIPLLVLVLLAPSAWYWLLHTQSGARFIWGLAVSATDDTLSAVSITGDVSAGVTFGRIEFTDDSVIVSVAEVKLDADVDLLPLRVTIGSAQASGLEVQLVDNDGSDDEATDIRETLGKLKLPVEILVSDLVIHDISISGKTGDDIFAASSATLVGRWKNDIEIDEVVLVTPEADVRATGRLQLVVPNEMALEAHVDLQPRFTGLDDSVVVDVSAIGPLDDLAVSAISPSPAVELSGHIAGISQEIRWDVLLEVSGFSLPPGLNAPPLPTLWLTASATGGLQKMTAEAHAGFHDTDMQATINADMDLKASTVSGDLQWQNAHWPVGDAEPQVASRNGQVIVSGSLDDWSVDGTVELNAPQLPPGRFTVDGRGDREHAAVDILDGSVLGGTITGRAEYRWYERPAYLASLSLSNIRTSPLLPEWPGMLNGQLDVDGRQQPFELSAVLTDVNGQLKDKLLRAGGRIDIRDDRVSVDDLRLRHGETTLSMDGQPYTEDGLSFEVHVVELGDYVEDAYGSLSASGTLSLANSKPFLRINASSDAIGYGDLQITDLAVDDRSAGTSILNAEFIAGTIAYGEIQAGNVRLQTSMDRQSQSVDLDLSADGLRAGLAITGALDDWEQPTVWTGQISRLELDHEGFSASLQQPTDINLARERVDAERLCIAGERSISLCLDGAWQGEDGYSLLANLSSVPVNLVNAFFDTRLQFDQVVSGDFSWRKNHDAASAGRADIAITSGTIVSIDRPDLQIATAQGKIGFDVRDDSLRAGVISLPIPELGQIAGEFELLDIADEDAAGISGMIDVDLADIEFLAAFLPTLDGTGGRLRADLDISGTVAAPVIVGDVELQHGTLSYLPIGLKLNDIELNGNLQRNSEIEMSGSFRAGEGLARIRTRSDHSRTAATGLELRLQGENLTLIDVPDVRAVADTDIGINFNGKSLGIDGRIEIPRARITPANIGISRVSESDDVIIVAGQLPDEETAEADDADLDISGSLEVAFGDDVVIDLELAEANLTGSTVFTWSGPRMPHANGRYDIGGEILVFGQKLEIVDGSVRFADVPADNPYLRIRAEREIFGNTQVRRAGVLVAGSLDSPTVEAYTSPMTTEERALTLLVTGSEFDYERGIGALDFGTYIAPRVYASYGIGLFDTENVIRLRYDLKRGFGITGTSGQRDSGVDLSYRFDN